MILLAAQPVEAPPVDDPGALPAAPPPELFPLSLTWTSYAGRTWNLSDWASPLLLTMGVGGLGMTSPEHWWQDSPSLDGSSWDGMRTGRGSVFLPLFLTADTSAEFQTLHRDFITSLNPRETGVLRVTHPDGNWREQVCRYESGADAIMDIDPVLAARIAYGITWATADPFWSGEPVVQEYPYSAGGNFFPGPPFTILPSQILGAGTATNPGDVDAYPLWHIDGPFTGFTVGVGAAVVSATLTKTVGQWIEIDMRPNKLTVLDDSGTDRWTSLTDANFSSIPPGDSDLDTTLVGADVGSNVSLSFTPRYWSAL